MRSIFLAALIAAGFAMVPASTLAQIGVVSGMVHSGTDMQPLASATVRWKGTNTGTFTGPDGWFTISRVAEADTLVISYVGFAPLILVAPDDTVHVMLEATTEAEVSVEADASTISRAPIRTETVTRKELTRAACCSLAESFERSPSVEVSFTDAVSGARTIRLLGLSGQYTQMLTDAVPLMRAIEIPFGLDHIPGPFMDNISIAKGAATVSNGYEGQTGVINVCLLDPLVTEEKLYVNAYVNTMARAELNLYGAQQLSDELATITMLHGRLQQREIDNNGDGFMDTPKFQQLNVFNKWRFNDDETEWQFFIHGLVDEYTSGQLEGTEPTDPAMGLYTIGTNIERLESYMKYGLLNVFDDLEQSSLAFVLSGVMHNMESAFGDRTVDARQRTLQAKAILTATLSSDLVLNTGLSYVLDDVRESLAATRLERQESVPGVYAEATWTPLEPLSLVGGLRYDQHNLYGGFTTPRVHARWSVSDFTSVRASAGRGWRVPSVITENLSAYINSRTLNFDSAFRPEESWNYGGSITTSFSIGGRPVVVDAEVYHTEFDNKVVVDFDRSARHVWVTNLTGRSYSTSAMAQVQFTPVPRLDLGVAYRWIDVQAPYNGTLQQAPMVSRDRVLLTAAWETVGSTWQVDATMQYYGPGRLPTTAENPTAYQRGDTYPGYVRVNGQITHRIGAWDVYLGGENLNGFIQQDPVIAADDPFSTYFDASLAWGPTSPRMAYLGVRWRVE